LSPKEFLQAITIDHARKLLRNSASILDTSIELGLSGPSRLHDLFLDHEAMTPGEFKLGGEGKTIHFGYHESPFGLALLMITDRGLCGLAFADNEAGKQLMLEDMKKRWPNAEYRFAPDSTAPFAEQVFNRGSRTSDRPLRIVLIGTDFERRVWETLLKIPAGHAVSYSDIARHIDKPQAVRAVGSAVGRNPISFVIPCHRVLRKDGDLGGYHWGVTRKKAIIGWESGQSLHA
jgi:AraC family transcriptional regulator of adaptative response/methylated-DNA-[protein]-cysteine methyltransferase